MKASRGRAGALAKTSETGAMAAAIRRTILEISRGKVATYGQVAEAAGFPLRHRQVAQVLRGTGHGLPWHRVLGAGGAIKTRQEAALEQRLLLEMEGVGFRGARVNLAEFQNDFESESKRRNKRRSGI